MEQVDRSIAEVKGVTADKAIQILQDKIRERIMSGPNELRRAFQFFDADGSGKIDHAEFKLAMRQRTNLEFSDSLITEIMSRYVDMTNNAGELDFNSFSNLVMGEYRVRRLHC